MEDVIQIDDQWYYAASSQRSDSRTQVLKQGNTFVVLDRLGDISRTGLGEQGLYHRGTRHLSHWELLINYRRPMLLNSTVKRDNSVLVTDLTNPDVHREGRLILKKGHVHVCRSVVVEAGALYEHLQLANYDAEFLELAVTYQFAADYADIFEVRGASRPAKGELLPAEVGEDCVVLMYRGLDRVTRFTRIQFPDTAGTIRDHECVLKIELAPGEERKLHLNVVCGDNTDSIPERNQALVVEKVDRVIETSHRERTQITTSNEQFNHWIDRSSADLLMLTTETSSGPYPYAGVPWFSTPFGRDGIITALQTLWIQPSLSRGVLRFLADTQATQLDAAAEAEPGKIFHEVREGEMAALGEVPFRQYYGTVDATPLFVVLAGHYYRRTGDREFLESIWPNIQKAIQWIDEYGDIDGDGMLEYDCHNAKGLKQQGWKDSDDSVFHADGSDAAAPITLSEVQGYVYEAKLMAAELAQVIGDDAFANRLRSEAEKLKRRFNELFWVESIQTFAIALDAQKKPCEVRSSNAGHLLYSGIVDADHASKVAATLTDENAFNGWGIRTIFKGEARYNPMSYHNGSIWPHDTAIGAAGLARYGYRQETAMLMTGLLDASMYLEWHRLPELFCGFDRLMGHGPTRYPVACSPQAWAAGSIFMLLQACLGLQFSPASPQIRFDHPTLPSYLQWVSITNLQVGDAVVDLSLRRHPRDVGLNIDRKVGDVDVAVTL